MTIIPPLTHPRFNSPGRAHNHKPSHFVNNLRTFSSFQKLPLNIYKSVSVSRVATKLTKRIRIIKNKRSQRFQNNLQTMGAPEKDPREEVLQAWYMDDSDEDQRLPHHKEPKEFVSLDQLAELGVLSWRLDADNYETDEEFKKIRESRGYSYMDFCEVSPEKLPNYEEKIKNFFEEHLHTDEEIRYAVAGSGYFDVRDRNDKWIRVWVKKGGMIILPAGIYHRFTLDSDNYIKAMRLFIGDPIWTPFNRPHDDLPARKEYLKTFVEKVEKEVGDRAVDAAA